MSDPKDGKLATEEKKDGEKQNLDFSVDSADQEPSFRDIGRKGEDKNQTVIGGFTGERDYELAPRSDDVLPWEFFCSDFYSTDRNIEEVSEITRKYGHKYVDLRPYFIENPYMVLTTDKLPKCLDLFRHMHLRSLPVNDPNKGMPVAVLTRQDIFAYMSL